MTAHFYRMAPSPPCFSWANFMMPFYYGSRARGVPEYLKLHFDEKTRALKAVTFDIMTLFSSGLSMYALGLLFELVPGWSPDHRMIHRFLNTLPPMKNTGRFRPRRLSMWSAPVTIGWVETSTGTTEVYHFAILSPGF